MHKEYSKHKEKKLANLLLTFVYLVILKIIQYFLVEKKRQILKHINLNSKVLHQTINLIHTIRKILLKQAYYQKRKEKHKMI